MTALRQVSTIALAGLTFLAVGCGGGPAPVTLYGAAAPAPHLRIMTQVLHPVEYWPNVKITGYANPNTVQCDPTQDASCIPMVGSFLYGLNQNAISSFNTNANGFADFGSDAITAEWYFFASDNGSTQCPGGGAQTTTVTGLSTGAQVPLNCNQNTAMMIATPSSCFDNEQTGNNTCPATITLTYPPPVSSSYALPLNTTLVYTNYDSAGDNLGQTNVQAGSTSSVSIPTPTAVSGTPTFIAIQDTSGNIIGMSEFTYTYRPPACPDSVSSLHTVSPNIANCP